MAYEKIQKELSLIREKKPINSNAEMYKAVENILNKEMKQGKKKDCDLIDECVETLLMLSGHDIDKLNERTNQTNGETLAEIHEKIKQKQTGRISSLKRNKMIVTTVWVVIILVVASTAAYAFDLLPFGHIRKIFSIPVGESIIMDGITYVRHGEATQYDTIDELFNEEKISLVYPSYLPGGISITQIKVISISNDDVEYIFEFSSNDLAYAAHSYHIYDIDVMEDQVMAYKTDSNIYYILEYDSKYNVYFEYDGNQYILQHSSYMETIKITENMKGYK